MNGAEIYNQYARELGLEGVRVESPAFRSGGAYAMLAKGIPMTDRTKYLLRLRGEGEKEIDYLYLKYRNAGEVNNQWGIVGQLMFPGGDAQLEVMDEEMCRAIGSDSRLMDELAKRIKSEPGGSVLVVSAHGWGKRLRWGTRDGAGGGVLANEVLNDPRVVGDDCRAVVVAACNPEWVRLPNARGEVPVFYPMGDTMALQPGEGHISDEEREGWLEKLVRRF